METRPRSIVDFERCYLGAFVLGVVNTALSWSTTRAAFEASPQAEMMGHWFLPVVTLIGFAITLTLWYFIARRGSAVAKWIATVFLALGVIGVVLAVLMGSYPTAIGGVLAIVITVLQAVAITLLFKPDTRSWFGETRSDAA